MEIPTRSIALMHRTRFEGMDAEAILTHLLRIGAISTTDTKEDDMLQFLEVFCNQRTLEDVSTGAMWSECLLPRKMLPTDLFIAAVHG